MKKILAVLLCTFCEAIFAGSYLSGNEIYENLISGSEDLAAPVAEFVAVKTAIQNSSYLMLEAAHISNIEREKYFTSAVSNFLKLNLST